MMNKVYINGVEVGTIKRSQLTPIKSQLNIPKVKLREKINYNFNKYEQRIIDKAYDNIIKYLKEYNPCVSEKEMRLFVEKFIELHLETEYDMKTMEYIITVTPVWKENNNLSANERELL